MREILDMGEGFNVLVESLLQTDRNPFNIFSEEDVQVEGEKGNQSISWTSFSPTTGEVEQGKNKK